MKRKLVSIILVAVLCTSLLAGCGAKKETAGTNVTADDAADNKSSNKDMVTIRFWGGVPPETGPQDVVDRFNEEYKDKGIQVEYERYVNDDQGNLKLETSLLAGSDIDVYVSYGTYKMQKRAEGGMALDLSELMTRDNFDYEGMFGSDVKADYINGKPYSIASVITKGTLLLNKDMFDAAGIAIPTEWTFDEFREVCKKLTKGEGQDKVYGMFWNTQQNITEYWLYLAMQTLGGNPLYKEGGKETNFDNDVLKKTAELVYNTMNVDKTAPTHVDSITQKLTQESMFLTGHSAMIVGNWAIRSVKDKEQYPHDFVTAYAPYPVISKDQRNYVYGGLGDEISINPKSENVDAAWEFVKWYTQDGVSSMAAGGRIALCNKVDKNVLAESFSKGAEDLIDMDSAKALVFPVGGEKLTIPTITTSLPEIQKILAEETEAYFTDQKDLDTAFADAKSRSDELLK
ncbi:extracellular solute-binding protein [Anaerocolumna sedimenticola]|uniref:Extracellular solute-binding protein n=1 Tax=Anaerocolumna sedimenticola TaxID=2696063 RepID=A0A6P1TI28_9FIRM|nr:extracellular solute-binding protein [Anaerocolumna sedimenticola]QHQ60870.1 extracellular solute-binding protein [Anaerocolumna sedimenticola]